MNVIEKMLWPFPGTKVGLCGRIMRSIGKRVIKVKEPGYFHRPKFTSVEKERIVGAARHYFEHPLRSRVAESLAKSQSSGASWSDFHVLHQYVMVKKPERVLELGSGVTSVVLASAFAELHAKGEKSGHVDSFEHLAEYHEDVKKVTPEDLKQFVTFYLSPMVSERWRELVPTVRYESLPKQKYQMAFIDGPPAGEVCTGDPLILASTAEEPVDFIIDRRKATCLTLARWFPEGTVCFDYARDLGLATVCRKTMLEQPRNWASLPNRDALDFFGIRQN